MKICSFLFTYKIFSLFYIYNLMAILYVYLFQRWLILWNWTIKIWLFLYGTQHNFARTAVDGTLLTLTTRDVNMIQRHDMISSKRCGSKSFGGTKITRRIHLFIRRLGALFAVSYFRLSFLINLINLVNFFFSLNRLHF